MRPHGSDDYRDARRMTPLLAARHLKTYEGIREVVYRNASRQRRETIKRCFAQKFTGWSVQAAIGAKLHLTTGLDCRQ